jgi:hypothetical protein
MVHWHALARWRRSFSSTESRMYEKHGVEWLLRTISPRRGVN